MKSLPNPWLSDPAAARPIAYAAGQAAAPTMPPDAAADPFPSNPSPVGATDNFGSNISDVGELFTFARMLCAQARIHPGTISPQAVAVAEEIKAHEEAYYDPLPLFLRRAS